jgi:hypothetical protein
MPAPHTVRSAPRAEPKQLVQVRLPIGILAQIDARVGLDFEHRSQALRTHARNTLTEAVLTAIARALDPPKPPPPRIDPQLAYLPSHVFALRAGHLNFASPARTADDYPADYLRKGLE